MKYIYIFLKGREILQYDLGLLTGDQGLISQKEMWHQEKLIKLHALHMQADIGEYKLYMGNCNNDH